MVQGEPMPHPRVVLTPVDTVERGVPTAGPGLLLDVPSEGRWLQRPSLHVEVSAPFALRLVSGGQPLLWMRIEDEWDWAHVMRGPADAPWGLPPLTGPELQSIPHPPGTDGWWTAWAWRLGNLLAEAPETVLHSGRWSLRPLRAIPASGAEPRSTCPYHSEANRLAPPWLDGVLRFEPFWEDWGHGEGNGLPPKPGAVLPLRAPSDPDDSQVKSWREHARAGTLPPVLVMYLDLFSKWLVLDGHDRAHAALLEGKQPPLLGLWRLEELEPRLWSPSSPCCTYEYPWSRHCTVTRAWPMAGGFRAWLAEVLAWRRWNHSEVDPVQWGCFTDPEP
jgi:hypothetical protein